MAFTYTQLDAIEEAIAMGFLTITFDGKTVTYQSVDALIRARDIIKSSLADQGLIDKPSRNVLAEFRRD